MAEGGVATDGEATRVTVARNERRGPQGNDNVPCALLAIAGIEAKNNFIITIRCDPGLPRIAERFDTVNDDRANDDGGALRSHPASIESDPKRCRHEVMKQGAELLYLPTSGT